MFSAAQFKTMRVATTTKYFQQDLLCVKMNPIVNQLKEVIVKTFSNINALSLGIISNSQKKYTAAGPLLTLLLRRVRAGWLGVISLRILY